MEEDKKRMKIKVLPLTDIILRWIDVEGVMMRDTKKMISIFDSRLPKDRVIEVRESHVEGSIIWAETTPMGVTWGMPSLIIESVIEVKDD